MWRLWAVCLFVAGPAPAADKQKRPAVDVQAMREAMRSDEPEQSFGSAASYAHFLSARLKHHDGDHRAALDELRLALATDDGNPFLLTALAEQYARLSELDRAEATLKRTLEKAPDYAPAQLLMGRVLYEGQKVTRARAHLLRAIKLRPKDSEAYLVLTQICLDQGKPDEAVKVVEELATAVPGDPVGFRRLGLAFAERGDGPRAEKLLNRAVERDPGDEESWLALAQILEQSNRLAQAADALDRVIERQPENRDALLSAGRLALRLDSPSRARAYFDQLLSLSRDPELAVKVAFSYLALRQLPAAAEVLDQTRVQGTEPRLHFYAGLVHERLKWWAKAADAFGAVTQESGELFHEARLHRATALSSAGQHGKALELFKKLNAERPDYPQLTAAWARALERAGQAKEAEAMLQRAVADRPSAENFEELSHHYERQGRLAEAVNLLSAALKKRPRDEALLYTLGAVYERKGEVQKSLEKMRAVLDVNPDNADALNFLGYVLADRNLDTTEAEKLLTRALELKPEHGAFLDSMGWLHYRKGDYPRAVEMLRRAADAAPGEPTIEEHLGDAWAQLSKRTEAEAAYKRAIEALKEEPDHAETRTQRAGIEKKLKALSSQRD